MPYSNQPPLEPHPVYDAPGCGLASYSCLLLMIFLIGVTGIVFSSMSLLQSSFKQRPFALVPGHQVEVWRLQPMREAGLLELTEIPLHYHDESGNGTAACAITETGLLRLDGEQAWTIPWTSMERAEIVRDPPDITVFVHTIDQQSLPCFFNPSEGAERMLIRLRERIPQPNP